MTHVPDLTSLEPVVQLLTEHGFDGAAEALEGLFNIAMRLERSLVLKAGPYERNGERLGHANGFKPKTLRTRLGELQLAVPQVRGEISFYPSALEKGARSERALTLALAEMDISGVSTRKVRAVLETMCGTEITSTQVSRATQELDAEFEKWRQRGLGCYPFLVLDALYEKVRINGSVISCAVLIAIGVDAAGRRSVLGVSVATSEAELHWRSFLLQLQQRGLSGVRFVVSDDHRGLTAALATVLPNVPWQRCQFHLQQNAQAFATSLSMRAQIGADLRAIFQAQSRAEADDRLRAVAAKCRASTPRFSDWIEANVPQGLAVFGLAIALRRRLRTSNVIERLNREIRRRTRVATLFPNEASLLRLVTAVLVEISEEWETSRVYLNPETGAESA